MGAVVTAGVAAGPAQAASRDNTISNVKILIHLVFTLVLLEKSNELVYRNPKFSFTPLGSTSPPFRNHHEID